MYFLILIFVFIQTFFVQNALSQYANFGPGIGNPNLGYGDINGYGLNYGYPPGLAPGLTPGLAPGLAGINPYAAGAELAIDVAKELGGYSGTGIGDIEIVGEMPVIGTTLVAGQVPIIGSVRFSGDVPAAGVVSVSGACGCGCGFGTYI